MMINTGDTVYYHGTHTQMHGRRFKVVASYPVGLHPRYDLAAAGDQTRTVVLVSARAASLTVIEPSSIATYIRQAFGPVGLR